MFLINTFFFIWMAIVIGAMAALEVDLDSAGKSVTHIPLVRLQPSMAYWS